MGAALEDLLFVLSAWLAAAAALCGCLLRFHFSQPRMSHFYHLNDSFHLRASTVTGVIDPQTWAAALACPEPTIP